MNTNIWQWFVGCAAWLAMCNALAESPPTEQITPEVITQEAITPELITLDQSIALVLERHPALRASDYEAAAAAARIRQARLAPPLRAGVELENFAGSGDTSGIDVLETTLSLSRVLQLGNKSQLRGELAQQKALMLGNQQDARRLDLLAVTSRRFLKVVADQDRVKIAGDAVELAQQTLEIVRRRVKVGKTATAERSRATIRLARAELELENAERTLDSARVSLVSSWGDSRASFSKATADLFILPSVPPFETLEAHLERNPDLLQFATAQRVGEAREQLARASRRPNIELSAGVRYLNEPDDTAFVFLASTPLGSARRAVHASDEAEALKLSAPYVYETRRLELHRTLYALHQQLQRSRSAVTSLHERIIPAAEQALKGYERGYRAGRYSYLELTDAQRVLLEARSEVIDTAADHHRFRIEIDRLTGGIVMTGENQ